MNKIFKQRLTKNPIIAAVKDISNVQNALSSECEIIFLLCGSISVLKQTIEEVKSKNKMIFVHVDLIDGLGKDAAAIKYLKNEFAPDGIISTKNHILKAARKEGLLTIQRFFLLDSISLSQCLKQSNESMPDAIEIMPGVMPDIIKEISGQVSAPVIVGGLVRKQKDIENALSSGAMGVSASETSLW